MMSAKMLSLIIFRSRHGFSGSRVIRSVADAHAFATTAIRGSRIWTRFRPSFKREEVSTRVAVEDSRLTVFFTVIPSAQR